MEIERIPEMVGATDAQPISLGPQPQSVEFVVKDPSGPAALARMAGRGPAAAPEVHLNLENITAEARPIQAYTVYVNLPEGANADNYPQFKAGRLPRFGIVEASRQTREHAGDGMNVSFNITRVVDALKRANSWNPERLRVTFVPRDNTVTAAESVKPVKVGRISLYYA
jgi:tyrosinase